MPNVNSSLRRPQYSKKGSCVNCVLGVKAMKIRIVVGDLSLEGELNETLTARKIAEVLPIKADFKTWGDEIYFTIPVHVELDQNAREEVEPGDLGYWPPGKAFCIFFGQTPMSPPGKIVPASAVNLIGRILGDASRLKEVMGEKEILLEKL
jgi:hypothetical protein